jgi:hypothetical protein
MKKQERLAPFPREPTGTLASVRYEPCTVYVRHIGWPRGGDDRVQGDGATGLATRCTVCGALVRRASLFEIGDKHSFVAEDLDSNAGEGNLVSISMGRQVKPDQVNWGVVGICSQFRRERLRQAVHVLLGLRKLAWQ